MKKIILIIFSFVFLSCNVFANDRTIKNFNEWLLQNNFTEYVEINEHYEECRNCSLEALPRCWEESGKPKKQCVIDGDQNLGDYGFKWEEQSKYKNNLKIKFYDNRSEIPEKVKPNYDTLLYYYWMYTNSNWNNNSVYSNIKASEKPYEFKFDLRNDKIVKKQMQKTALLSYLLYEDGKIVVDEISPQDKFGRVFTNETKFHSQSVGKSLVSYTLGHAICKGYVESIDAQLNDWPLIKNSLYYNQKIIDIINMAAGDKEYFSKKDSANRYKKTDRSVSNTTIKKAIENEFKNSKKSSNKYSYNNFLPHLIMNYIVFKAGEENYQQLMNDIFREKIGIEHEVNFVEPETSEPSDRSTTSTFLASRYDYMRIAKSMLDDWKNDTCEGKFLKSIYERKINKNRDYRDKKHAFNNTKSYGGFFHLDPSGMKNRPVFIMDGYGGQTLTIDFDRGRIVTTLAVHRDFNWMKIAHSVIKKGK